MVAGGEHVQLGTVNMLSGIQFYLLVMLVFLFATAICYDTDPDFRSFFGCLSRNTVNRDMLLTSSKSGYHAFLRLLAPSCACMTELKDGFFSMAVPCEWADESVV